MKADKKEFEKHIKDFLVEAGTRHAFLNQGIGLKFDRVHWALLVTKEK